MFTESFAFYISVLRKDFTAYCTEKLAQKGITNGQLYIMLYVGKHPNCSPKQISVALHLDAGHLNRTLCKMVQNGLIVQTKSQTDKRASIVCLSEKGEEVFAESRKLFLEWDKEVLAGLQESEQQTLKKLIQKALLSKKTDWRKHNEQVE